MSSLNNDDKPSRDSNAPTPSLPPQRKLSDSGALKSKLTTTVSKLNINGSYAAGSEIAVKKPISKIDIDKYNP